MVALVSFLLVLTLSLIIERIATAGLTLTSLSCGAAWFHERSAFTGAGSHSDAVAVQRQLLRDQNVHDDRISAGTYKDGIGASASVGPKSAAT